MRPGVSVVIPTIPPREDLLLDRAMHSVLQQLRPVDAVIVSVDHERLGAWEARNRGIECVRTEWTCFLDDDDELWPQHTAFLLDRSDDVDVVWGHFVVVGGTDPFPHHAGKQWDPDEPHIFPITVMARTELLQQALLEHGGFQPDERGDWKDQDFPMWKAVADLGGRFRAYPDATWSWHHHAANTSGLPARWPTSTPAT